MFARLYTNSGDVKTAYSELSKVITGAITNPASLTAFNSATSTIVTTQPSNWVEYTTVGSTNAVNAGVAIWFRQRNRAGRWKYACIYRTTSPTNTHKGLLRHYTDASPTVVASVAGVATNNSEAYGATTEYTVAAGPGYLFVATKLTTSPYFTETHMWLEYPETGNSAYLSLPNHVLYRHYSTGTSYAVDATTDIAYSTGIVEVAKPSGNADVQVLNGGMSAPTTMHGTMKPSYFTSFCNTLDSSGNFVERPFLQLFYESTYQGLLDCSTLTNVWGTGATASLSVASNVALLTCASGYFEDLSSNSLAVTKLGDTAISNLSPYSSGTGWSCLFDGNGDYLSIANNAAFNPGTGDFCVEGWFYITSLSAITNLWGCDNGGGATAKWMVVADSAGSLQFHFTVNGGTALITTSAGAVTTGSWTHIAVVRNSSVVKLYVNGTSIATANSSLNMTGLTAPWTIGYIGEPWGSMLNGRVSNFRYVKGAAIYTTNFTPSTTAPSYDVLGYGDSVTAHGSEYAYLRANGSLSYLVPKR